MKLSDLLAAKERELRSATDERDAAFARQNSILDGVTAAGRSALTPQEDADVRSASDAKRAAAAKVDALTSEVDTLRAEIKSDEEYVARSSETRAAAERPKYNEVARTGIEPRTYARHLSDSGERSFFADFYRAEQRNDYQARERLERHMVEVRAEGELTERALSTGGAAGLVIPQYLVALAAPVLRTGRPFANICNRGPLPDQGMSLIIPRGTTGASAAAQATENSAVSNTDEVWANLTVPVVTIAGQQQVSRQLLDRGGAGVDRIIYTDLAKAYHANLGGQTLTGTGTGGTMLGLQNTAGIGAATAYGAAPTLTLFNSKIAGQYNAVAGTGSGITARVIVMHPRRWAWLLSLVDSTGRPIVTANQVANFNAAAVNLVPGEMSADAGDTDSMQVQFVGIHNPSGLPILTDNGVPVNVGTNVEDLVFVVDNSETYLWEDGDGMPTELRFEQTLGGSLTTTLVVEGYAAFTAGRYPTAVGKIGGLDATATWGHVAPSF